MSYAHHYSPDRLYGPQILNGSMDDWLEAAGGGGVPLASVSVTSKGSTHLSPSVDESGHYGLLHPQMVSLLHKCPRDKMGILL